MKGFVQHSDDLSLSDLEKYLFTPYGLNFATLEGFPPPSYSHKDGPRWTYFDVQPWAETFFRMFAPMASSFQEYVRFEERLRPGREPHEHRQRALDRFVAVCTARVITKRLPP